MTDTPMPSTPPMPNVSFSSNMQPPAKNDNNRILLIIFILLLIAAIGGGLVAYQRLNQPTEEITQVQPTLAWKPTITGTCEGGRIVRDEESVPFLVTLDLKLNDSESSPTQTFLSQEPGNFINKAFDWNFSTSVKKGDKIKWNATVKYTKNGNLREEKYDGTIEIKSDCEAPSPSPSPTDEPSITPTASPSVAPSATPAKTPSSSPSSTPSDTPEPSSTPPIGGPSITPTPSPTTTSTPGPTSTPVAESSSTPTPDVRDVADSSTLPEAGVSNGVLFTIIGAVSLFISGIFALLKKKYY